MNTPDYTKFRQDDYLEDDFFCTWVKYKRPEAEEFWQAWQAAIPSNLAAFTAAREELMLILGAERLLPAAGEEEEVWKMIESSLDQQVDKVRTIRFTFRKYVVAAAVVLVVLASAGWFFFIYNPRVTVQTAYGQLDTLKMPDASVIKLNAHSTIRYLSRWKNGSPREVYLQGEAWFDVQHVQNENGLTPFMVYTDKVSVQVTGTVFNVKERRGRTEVSLEQGRVKVSLRRDTTQTIVMRPGDLVVYDHNTDELKKVTEDPAYHVDWTERKLLTNKTPVATILQELEEIYGYEVVLMDTSIGSRKIDGVLPIRNEANTLFILSNMLNIDIEKQGRKLIISNRK
ncbi:MAG: FecR family protein [Flavisolibacter sp.]